MKYKQLTKYEQFILLFWEWSQKLRVKGIIAIEKDNRFNCHLAVETIGEKNKQFRVKYNSRRLANWSYALIVSGVFHEIAHIKQDLDNDTFEKMVHCEYKAELYSVRMIKKYYPGMLKEIVDWTVRKMNNRKWRKEYPAHYAAFSKIKEYSNERGQ